LTLKTELRDLAKRMSDRMMEIYPESAMLFIADLNLVNSNEAFAFIYGEDEILHRCFRELEGKIRRLESCNMNPSNESKNEIQAIMEDLSQEADPEIEKLFTVASALLGDGGSGGFGGSAILMVGWKELGISFHRYVDFVGMVRSVVRLFNAGIDSFRSINQREEGQI